MATKFSFTRADDAFDFTKATLREFARTFPGRNTAFTVSAGLRYAANVEFTKRAKAFARDKNLEFIDAVKALLDDDECVQLYRVGTGKVALASEAEVGGMS